MKKVILCILFCIAVIAAPYVVDNHGYVFISVGDYTIETSVLFALIAVLALYLVIALVISLITKLVAARSQVSSFIRSRRTTVSRSNLSAGVIAMAEHRYDDAENLFRNKTHKNYRSVANYLLASYAYIKLNSEEKFLECLKKAEELEPKAGLACLLIKSDFYLKRKQYDKSVEILENARTRFGSIPLICRKLSGIYLLLGDYDHLKGILSQVKKDRAFEYDDFLKIQLNVYQNDLSSIETSEAAKSLWEEVSRSFKKEPAVKGLFASRIAVLGDVETAEKILLEGFRKCDVSKMLDEIVNCDTFLPQVVKYMQDHLTEDERICTRLYRAFAKQMFLTGNYSEALDWYGKLPPESIPAQEYSVICQCYEKVNHQLASLSK